MSRVVYVVGAMCLIASLVVTGCSSNEAADQSDLPQVTEREMAFEPTTTENIADIPGALPRLSATELAEQLQASTSFDWMVVESLEDLVKQSELIVVGKVTGPDEIINMARDVDDISKPDPAIFGLGQVYEIAVEQYLQGKGPSVLKVVQAEGFVSSRDGKPFDQTFTADEIAQIKQASLRNEGHVPLTVGGRYVFFLGDLDSGFEPGAYLTGAAGIPWRLVITHDGSLTPESPAAEANERIEEISLDELVLIVEMGPASR